MPPATRTLASMKNCVTTTLDVSAVCAEARTEKSARPAALEADDDDGWCAALPHAAVPGPLVASVLDEWLPLTGLRGVTDAHCVRCCDGVAFHSRHPAPAVDTDGLLLDVLDLRPARVKRVSFRDSTVTTASVLGLAAYPTVEALDLQCCPLLGPQLRCLLPKLPYLRSLAVDDCRGVSEAFDCLPSCPNLTSVTDSHGAAVRHFPHCSMLQEVTLCHFTVSCQDVQALSQTPRLRTLTFRDHPNGAFEQFGLAKAFRNGFLVLEELRFEGVVPFGVVAPALPHLPALRRLVIQCGPRANSRGTWSLDSDTLSPVTQCFHLQELEVCAPGAALQGLLRLSDVPGLRSLAVSVAGGRGTSDAERTVARVVSGCIRLRALRLEAVGDDQMAACFGGLGDLEEVHLVDTSIGDAALAALADCPKLRTVVVDGCCSEALTQSGLRELSRRPSLRRVVMGRCRCVDMGSVETDIIRGFRPGVLSLDGAAPRSVSVSANASHAFLRGPQSSYNSKGRRRQ